jgi:hypothetical protein
MPELLPIRVPLQNEISCYAVFYLLSAEHQKRQIDHLPWHLHPTIHQCPQQFHPPYGLSQSCSGACYRIPIATSATLAYQQIAPYHEANLRLHGTYL